MFNASELDAALRARDEGRCLRILSELRSNEEWNWDVLIRIPDFWEQSESVAQAAYDLALDLGDRGVDLQAFVQSSLRKLRSGSSTRGVQHALRFLSLGLLKWRAASAWSRVNWSLYASELVELLNSEHRAPALDLMRLAIEQDPQHFPDRLSTSLFIRWTELAEDVRAELERELDPLAPGLIKRSERKQPELMPYSADAVLARLAQELPPFVMARGSISSRSGRSTRCLFYRIDGEKLSPLDEMWVEDSVLPAVIARLKARGPFWEASCDAMYATTAERIWIEQPFTYWEDLKRRIWREGDILYFDREHIPIGDLVSVEAYLEQGWVLRGVRLWMRKDGGTRCLKLAEVEDHISEIDPTYDGINLSFETEWAVTMARALSRALGIPAEIDPDMS